MKRKMLLAMVATVFSNSVVRADNDDITVQRLFESIVGVPIDQTDARFGQMKSRVQAGDLKGAAAIATEDSNFYSVTLFNWASRMYAKEESPLATLTDYQALIIGTVRDDLDARGILTGDYLYLASNSNNAPSLTNNAHYAAISDNGTDLKAVLTRRSPQWPGFPEAAGVFTTRGWAEAHYDAGTNRRAVEYAFREFMCAPISQWKDTGLPVDRIRRDVDRAPGGNPSTFQSLCRTCHAAMDGMAGAFARLDFVNARMVHMGDGWAAKYSQNAQTYPEGYETTGDSWVNFATQNHNAAFGWRGPTSGMGVAAFALMLANSQGFKQCMARRVFREVCRREAIQDDQAELSRVADLFETEGYKLKGLFQNVATSTRCL